MRSIRRNRAKLVFAGAIAAAFSGMLSTQSNASILTIGNWSVDAVYNVDETVNTNTGTAPVVTTTEGQSDGIVAGFSQISLNPGDQLTFSGTILLPNPDTGGDQFRIGLMDNTTGNNPPSGDTDWNGYLVEVPNGTDHSFLIGARSNNPQSSGNWASGTGLTTISSTNTSTTTANAPGSPVSELFSITLTWTGGGSANALAASMVSNDGPPATYNVAANAADSGGDTQTQNNDVYNEIGFFFGSSTFGGASNVAYQTSFSNLAVTYTPAVPEPASIGLLGVSLGLLVGRRRSKM